MHLNDTQLIRDANPNLDGICAACGRPATDHDPLVISDGYRIHTSHTTDPRSGFTPHHGGQR